MKERPILFSAPMVRAILEGRKTQTRRVVKCDTYKIKRKASPLEWDSGRADSRMVDAETLMSQKGYGLFIAEEGPVFGLRSPFGKPMDRLWVRETWATSRLYDLMPPREIPPNKELFYAADGKDGWNNNARVRQSIFMMRWASRITIEITDVRVERLQDITEDDAKAEGVNTKLETYSFELKTSEKFGYRYSFSYLWDSINAKKHPWTSNPWVWVIEFKLV